MKAPVQASAVRLGAHEGVPYAGMRICHLAAVDFTVKHFIAPMMRHQERGGAQVAAIVSRGEYFDELSASGLKVLGCPMSRRLRPVEQLRAFWRLQHLLEREKPHILHCHTPIPGLLGRAAGLLTRVPMRLYTVHGFHFHEHGPALRNILIRRLEQLGARLGHDLLFVSREDCEAARRLRLRPPEQLHWVGNGIDLTGSSTADVPTRESLGIPGDRVVVGFVGRMVGEKGLGELLAAAGKLVRRGARIHLLLVGGRLASDPAESRQGWRALLDDPVLAGRVAETGLVPDARRYLPLMDIFTLPSLREGLPVALMEAMADRRACIATEIRGCRELILPGVNGLLVPVGDSSALAEAIMKLYEKPVQRMAFGEAARETIASRYTTEAWLARCDRAYAAAMGRQ